MPGRVASSHILLSFVPAVSAKATMEMEEEKRVLTGRRPIHTDEQIVEALECCGGVVSHAAKTLGRQNSALKKRIDRSEHLTEKLKELREVNIDFAESKLMELLSTGPPSAIL